MAHAKFSPSGATKWMTCAAALAEESQYPNESSTYADEGTAAHQILSRCLLKGTNAADYLGEVICVRQWEDKWYNVETNQYEKKLISERFFAVTDNMASAVQVAVNSVRNRLGDGVLLVEQKVSFSQAIGERNQDGTADIILVWPKLKLISVEDYKHGMGVRVFAKKNKQMTIYLLASLETFADVFDDFEGYSFETRVHQPRIDHEDVWECTDPEPLDREYIKQFTRQMMKASLDSNVALEYVTAKPPLPIPLEFYNPGDDQCRFCKAKNDCVGRTNFVSQQVYEEFGVLDDPNKVTVLVPRPPKRDRLGIVFSALDLIEDWVRSIRSEIDRMLLNDEEVIGTDGLPMKLIVGRKGARAWKKPQPIIEARLAGYLTEDKLYEPRQIISPAEADKLLNRKATEDIWEGLQDLITQAPGKPKPALGSDPGKLYVRDDVKATDFPDMTDPTT